MKKRLIFLLFILITLNFEHSFSDITSHFNKLNFKDSKSFQMKNLDFIYVINLDHRQDRMLKAYEQFSPYHIQPQRFPAIYGKNLSFKALQDIVLTFAPGMKGGFWSQTISFEGEPHFELVELNEKHYGRPCFWGLLGAIGCAMSHISVLQDALDSGYETIWVLEDDFLILKDPRILETLIEQLDKLVGKNNWDLLYTDTTLPIDKNIDKAIVEKYLRPDMEIPDKQNERYCISSEFAKIGLRERTHSMIIRRSGIEKILNHYITHRYFLPYDFELSFANLNKYSVTRDIVTYYQDVSDINN